MLAHIKIIKTEFTRNVPSEPKIVEYFLTEISGI